MADIDVYNPTIAFDAATLLEKQLASASLTCTNPSISSSPSVTRDFDTEAYNRLISVADANALFERQLTAAGLNRTQLFSQLAPFFLVETAEGPKSGPYAAYLVHRHYKLESGELMVETNNSTKPTKASTESDSFKIVPHIWSNTGQPIEFRSISKSDPPLPPPPTAEFLSKFKSFLDKKGISTLGICYADCTPPAGFINLEVNGSGDRERVVKRIRESEYIPKSDCYEVVWIPSKNTDGQSFSMIGACTCGDCECDYGRQRN